MIDPRWIALINYCQKNPYCTIERLEIMGGIPKLLVRKETLTEDTQVNIKIKL